MSNATAVRSPGPLESLRTAESGFVAHLHATSDAIEAVARGNVEIALERLAAVTRAAGQRFANAQSLEQSIVGELVDQLRQLNASFRSDLDATHPEPLLGVGAPGKTEATVVSQIALAQSPEEPPLAAAARCALSETRQAVGGGAVANLPCDCGSGLPWSAVLQGCAECRPTEDELKAELQEMTPDVRPFIAGGRQVEPDAPPFECDEDCPGCDDDAAPVAMTPGPARDDRPTPSGKPTPKRPRKRK